MCQKLEAKISQEYNNVEYWTNILLREKWQEVDKTKRDVEFLIEYYEGRFDMAVDMRAIIQ